MQFPLFLLNYKNLPAAEGSGKQYLYYLWYIRYTIRTKSRGRQIIFFALDENVHSCQKWED